jgi:hypothetical protein
VNCSLGLKGGSKASLSLVRSRLEGDEETSGDILLLQPPGPEWSIEANESRCSVVDSNVSHIIYQDQKEVIFFSSPYVHVVITFRFSVLQSGSAVIRIRIKIRYTLDVLAFLSLYSMTEVLILTKFCEIPRSMGTVQCKAVRHSKPTVDNVERLDW